jgi:hypothetical protein
VQAHCRNRTLLFLLTLTPLLAVAAKPNWAKRAVGFPGDCKSNCPAVRVVAPDKQTAVEVLYQDGAAYLRVSAPGQPAREIHDVFSSPHNDLMWAPDSKAFFVDAGEGITSPASLQVFRLDDTQLQAVDVTRQAEIDMVASFPPCKALYLDQKSCRKIGENPGYNMTAIDWVDDSSAVVVMAQVPCTANYGGISCQALGYELEVPTGKILKRMEPAQFKTEWQKSMLQRFTIPQPPEYQK